MHPGWVRSQSDGQAHHVGYVQLIRLWRLDPATCFLWRESVYVHREFDRFRHFYPDDTGRYELEMCELCGMENEHAPWCRTRVDSGRGPS